MFLIVGLGNTGLNYVNTRHNAGFMAIDSIAAQLSSEWQNKSKFHAQIAQIEINNNSARAPLLSDQTNKFYIADSIILCKPQTYMNLSGSSVAAISLFYKIPTNKIIVIHDDIDLPSGKIGYKIGGGTGGHNGLKSIDQSIGSNYHRIRIGIGRPENPKYEIADFVLGKFSSEEEVTLQASIEKIKDNVGLLLLDKIEQFKKAISNVLKT